MDFTSQDIAVIEQALQFAMRAQQGDSKSRAYQEVLAKLRTNAEAVMMAAPVQTISGLDGFRFDYDDSSDLS